MCSHDAPPPPDPAISEYAKDAARLGQEWLDFAKGAYADNKTLQEEQARRSNEISDLLLGMTKEDRERWENVYKPLEDQFINEAKTYDTPERQEAAAAQAMADVRKQAEMNRGAIERRDQQFGVRPDSGRYAGVERAAGIDEAAATVDAANRARQTVRDTGRAMRAAAVGLGTRLPGQVMGEAGAGLQAGQLPLSNQLAGTGIMNAGYGGGIGAYIGGSGALNSLYGNQLKAYQIQSQQDIYNMLGLGQFAGMGLGLMTKPLSSTSILGRMLSSKQAKRNRQDVPDGEALAVVKGLPIQTYDYKPGVGDGGSHVGPMAEDFQRATGLGDGRTIAYQDAIGLALGAIKDLARKIDGRGKPKAIRKTSDDDGDEQPSLVVMAIPRAQPMGLRASA